jgi:hypothetical protein
MGSAFSPAFKPYKSRPDQQHTKWWGDRIRGQRPRVYIQLDVWFLRQCSGSGHTCLALVMKPLLLLLWHSF